MKKTISMVVMVLAAVCVAFGETYERGKVYGPITMLGDEARTIDGNGAIIDGGGTARCATLGPNVTLKNFTFRNGKAAVGGGVWGGKVENCTISGCTATEYGAAVVNCAVSQAAITGCTLPLSSSKVAIHGGIAADSTLEGVTITGCRVELGTAAPGFGGIAANSEITNCTVTDNTLVVSGDHYGLLFYGGSLSKSTIQGNSVDSSLANVAAYMKVTPVDCALDGDKPLPPGPVPPGPVPPTPTPPDPPGPFDPWIAFENIYFKASLADLGATAVPTDHKITIKAEGLPKGLKLVTTALKDAKNRATGHYAYFVEGVPTETMDGLSRIAYVRVTDNKVQTLYALDLVVRPTADYEQRSFPEGTNKAVYANYSVQWLWDVAKNPKNWTFSGWPSGIKFTTKAVTSRKKIGGVYVTLTNALPYEVYGTPTKAGRFTVKAVEKIAGTSYKSTHVATFTVWPDVCEPEAEWTDQAYVGVYRGSATDVKSASGLPTGIKFTARDIISKSVVVTEAHHFYGKPTKAGTFAVTLTHDDKTKTQFLWTITPAAAPAFELKLTETEVDPETAKATIRQGVSYEWAVTNTLGSKVSASGLPSGLSLKSTAIKDGKTTIGYAYSVKGVPTKAGEYFATFKTTMNGVTTVTTAAFTVLALEPWAQGTFNGGADGSFPSGGQANLTLSNVGKLSGKWMSQGTNWTLSAASYDRYDPKSGSYVALMIGKTGSGKKAVSFTNELFVSKANSEYLGGVATNALFIGYQNVWKTEPWKTIGKKFTKAGTVILHPGVVGTNDTITLKFAASGTVTAAGKFEKSVDSKGKVSYYSVSASAVLCPQGDPDGYGAFTGVVFVYFPPKAKTPLPDGYSACVWVRWDGSSFAELPPRSDE